MQVDFESDWTDVKIAMVNDISAIESFGEFATLIDRKVTKGIYTFQTPIDNSPVRCLAIIDVNGNQCLIVHPAGNGNFYMDIIIATEIINNKVTKSVWLKQFSGTLSWDITDRSYFDLDSGIVPRLGISRLWGIVSVMVLLSLLVAFFI